MAKQFKVGQTISFTAVGHEGGREVGTIVNFSMLRKLPIVECERYNSTKSKRENVRFLAIPKSIREV